MIFDTAATISGMRPGATASALPSVRSEGASRGIPDGEAGDRGEGRGIVAVEDQSG